MGRSSTLTKTQTTLARRAGRSEVRLLSGYRLTIHRAQSRKGTEAWGHAGSGWLGNHDIVIDVDGEGVPVGIDIHSFASRIVDLTTLEAEGPIFGLVRQGDSDRRAS